MTLLEESTKLNNPDYFDFCNGLWKGKKPPYIKAKVIRNTNFSKNGVIDFSDVAELDVEQKQFEKKSLIPGDIIIERSGGGPKQPVERVVFFSVEYKDYSFSNFTSRIRVINKNLFNPKFIFYHLHNFYIEGKTDGLQQRTTGIRNLDYNKYKESVKIPFLSESDQLKIVYILNTIQNAIEKQEQLIKTTTELKKALIQKLFTEGLRGEKQKKTEIGLVPESWEVVELFDICELAGENYLPKSQGDTKYVGLEHIKSGKSNLSNWGMECEVKSSKTKFKKGYVLYGKLRPYLDKAVTAPFKGICSTDILVFNGKNSIENEFLVNLFHTDLFVKHAIATTSGVQHPRTSWSSINKLKIGLPSFEERKNFTKTLKCIELKIELINKKKEKLSDLFNTLLHQLMTGQISVDKVEFKEYKELSKVAESKEKYS